MGKQKINKKFVYNLQTGIICKEKKISLACHPVGWVCRVVS